VSKKFTEVTYLIEKPEGSLEGPPGLQD
jgi:hypothetical protein